MELYENNLIALRAYMASKKDRQNLQMVIYKAIAESTDLTAKDVDNVLQAIDRLLEVEEEIKPRPDPAL